MKRSLSSLVFIAACTVVRIKAQSPTTTIHIAETSQPVIIRLHPAKLSPGNFDSVSVRLSDSLQYSFATDNFIQPVPQEEPTGTNSGLPHAVPGFKLDHSRYFFQATYSVSNHPHTLLLFVGSSGASEANHAFLIAFQNDGTPCVALNLDQFEITSLAESTSDVKIIGKTSLSQVLSGGKDTGDKKPYATTYDPYSVFVLTLGESAKYSLAESEAYNHIHYVWAGPKAREDIAVLYNIAGHPRVFSTPASKVSVFIK